MFKLKSEYKPSGDQPAAIEKLSAGLARGARFQTLLGVTGSGKTFTMANLIARSDRPILVMAPNKALAAQLYREYKNYFPENSVHYFVSYYDYYQPEAYIPHSDTYIEKEATINEEIDRLRHEATTALLTRRDVIVVASVSCIYNLGVPLNYLEASLKLELGKIITRSDLIRQLVKLQLTRTNVDITRGTFRVRGDAFEIMPASSAKFVRVILAGQQVEKIELVNPVNLHLEKNLREVAIFPAKHFVSSEPQIKQAIKEIRAELKDRLAFLKKRGLLLEAERLERRTRYDLELINSLGFCSGIENYARHLAGKLAGDAPDTLISYFPKDFLTIMDESHIALPQVRGMYEGDQSRKETLVKFGWRLPSAMDNRPLKFEEFLGRVGQVIFTTATPGDWELSHSLQVVEQVIRPTGLVDPPVEVRPVFDRKNNRSQIDDVIAESKLVIAEKSRVIINTLTKKMAEDLAEYLAKAGIKSRYLHSDIGTLERTEILMDFRRGKFDILVGVNLLREGLDLPEVSLVAILDADREGFLRSDTSLVQTMGRAARHLRGKVILYADAMTGSMKRALDEVNRRRAKQLAYNEKHGITPKGVEKKIERFFDITDTPPAPWQGRKRSQNSSPAKGSGVK